MTRDLVSLWQMQERWVGKVGLCPPYWGLAWPGGQALARYVLDHPEVVRGKSVLDVGAGTGLCAIAAVVAGARAVTAADIDPDAAQAIAANAALNRCEITIATQDCVDCDGSWDVILAADLWYERFLARRVTRWLCAVAADGTLVLLGDPGRAHFFRPRPIVLASYWIEGTEATEQSTRIESFAWQLVPERPTSDQVARNAHQPCAERIHD